MGRLWTKPTYLYCQFVLHQILNSTTSSSFTTTTARIATAAATNISQLIGKQVFTNALDTPIDLSMISLWFVLILSATGLSRLAWIAEIGYTCTLYKSEINSSRLMVPLHTSTTLMSVHTVVSHSPMAINYNQPYLPICAGSCQIKRISHFHPFIPRLKNLHTWHSQSQDEREERRLEKLGI